MQTVAYERRPILIVFREASRIKETYAGRTDTVALEAHHLVPLGRPSDTVLVFMHRIRRCLSSCIQLAARSTCRWWPGWRAPAYT